jgi:hypothetical protein
MVERVIGAFAQECGYDSESGQSPGDFAKACVIDYIKGIVKQHETRAVFDTHMETIVTEQQQVIDDINESLGGVQ